MSKLSVVISQDRVAHSAGQQIEQALLAALGPLSEVEVLVVPHLYDLAPDGPGMKRLQAVQGDMILLGWLYPRAAFWILDANRVRGRMGHTSFFADEELPARPAGKYLSEPLPDRTIWCIDLRDHAQVEPLLAEIERILAEVFGEPVSAVATATAASINGHHRVDEQTRTRWYPVVDRSRCGGCLECLNFCLFGVFAIDDDGLLIVEEPGACRDGCPACSRICPSGAIMFPEHANPAIAGEPKAAGEAFRLDLSQLFGTTSAIDQAAAERQRALEQKSRQPAANQPPAEDKLDRMVDDLDKSDL
jgi:NAD-dependent dihydropyrimidine dehydrogenase PreA subunit